MKNEQLTNTLVALHQQGWSIRRLSRELGVSRGRIRRLLSANADQRQATARVVVKSPVKRQSKLDPYKESIAQLIDQYKDITGQRIYEHITEQGFEGKISIVREYLKTVRPKTPKTPIRLVETDPGQRAAHDWSDYRICFTGSDQQEQVTFFSYILAYSRRQYIEIVENKTQKTLFRALINAFIYLDGVPHEIKADNQKACVDRWEMGRPVFNAKYLEFASHYHFRPLTITPRRPTENLKIERPFYYLEKSFLNGREFSNREDLKTQLLGWLNDVNDLRIHATTRERPIERYITEHPHLQILPAQHYDTSQVLHLVVNLESCVQWKGYQYVVPSKYICETCPVRITEDHLTVYCPTGEQLVVHPLARPGQKERYVGRHQKSNQSTLPSISDVIERLQAFSPEMKDYIEILKRHKPKTWRYHLRGLLALKINYRIEDILIAVRRAEEYKVFDSTTIERFLSHNSESRYPVKLTFNRKQDEYES